MSQENSLECALREMSYRAVLGWSYTILELNRPLLESLAQKELERREAIGMWTRLLQRWKYRRRNSWKVDRPFDAVSVLDLYDRSDAHLLHLASCRDTLSELDTGSNHYQHICELVVVADGLTVFNEKNEFAYLQYCFLNYLVFLYEHSFDGCVDSFESDLTHFSRFLEYIPCFDRFDIATQEELSTKWALDIHEVSPRDSDSLEGSPIDGAWLIDYADKAKDDVDSATSPIGG